MRKMVVIFEKTQVLEQYWVQIMGAPLVGRSFVLLGGRESKVRVRGAVGKIHKDYEGFRAKGNQGPK